MVLETDESIEFADIVHRRGDDIPAFHGLGDAVVVDAILGNGLRSDGGIHDFTVAVLPVGSIREIEVATVVAETVIVGIGVLPSPVLGGELAVHRVLLGNVVADIVVQSVFKQWLAGGLNVRRADLDGQDARAVGERRRLVSGDEDLDT